MIITIDNFRYSFGYGLSTNSEKILSSGNNNYFKIIINTTFTLSKKTLHLKYVCIFLQLKLLPSLYPWALPSFWKFSYGIYKIYTRSFSKHITTSKIACLQLQLVGHE